MFAMKKYEGYHPESELPIKRGDKVRVPKGTFIRTTHPQRENGPSKRTQTVTINHILNGTDEHKGYHGEWQYRTNPSVVWAGTGGYWCEADINDVEQINA